MVSTTVEAVQILNDLLGYGLLTSLLKSLFSTKYRYLLPYLPYSLQHYLPDGMMGFSVVVPIKVLSLTVFLPPPLAIVHTVYCTQHSYSLVLILSLYRVQV